MVRMEIVFGVYNVKALESLGVVCGAYLMINEGLESRWTDSVGWIKGEAGRRWRLFVDHENRIGKN